MSVILSDVHKEAKANEGEIITMEQQHLTTELTFFGSVCFIFNVLWFTNLSKLAEVVLVILYSNAELEHLFRIV